MSDSECSELDVTEGAVVNEVPRSLMEGLSQPSRVSIANEEAEENPRTLSGEWKLPNTHRRKRGVSWIPVLNKETANPQTFDLEHLLDPKVQKKPMQEHRTNSGPDPEASKYLHKL